jgi:hypothetical protein
LIAFVIDVTTNAKKNSRRRRILASSENNFIENDLTIEDVIIEKADSLEKNDDSSNVFVVFTTSFTSRVASTSITSRSTRKRHDFLLKNENSFLKSRNISFVMREKIAEELMRSQNSNKSRRKSAIKNEIFRSNNLKHLID